jgi:dihydrolipoamide dehydrogenase
MKSFDVVVIGGGPGGYIAAIRAAQLGLSTACIDEAKGADGKPALGGTCTNVGCIPSKALLQSSENYEQVGHHFAEHGIKVKGLDLDLATMLKRKDKVVKASNDGVLYLFKKNKVEFFHGRASATARLRAMRFLFLIKKKFLERMWSSPPGRIPARFPGRSSTRS